MTAQIPENLIYEGQTYAMCSEPLADYFALAGKVKRDSGQVLSSLWRGYIGTWEVIDKRLYLIHVSDDMGRDDSSALAEYFPNNSGRVFAHWFSDTISIPQGKMLEYVHMGFQSRYERDLLLEFEKGVLVNATIKQNESSGPSEESLTD